MGKKYNKLETKIERTERRTHPGYSEKRVSYIAHAAAGKVFREKEAKLHSCDRCGSSHRRSGSLHECHSCGLPCMK